MTILVATAMVMSPAAIGIKAFTAWQLAREPDRVSPPRVTTDLSVHRGADQALSCQPSSAPFSGHINLIRKMERYRHLMVNSNPLDVVKIFKLSRASYNKMIQNIWWAAGYNIVAIPSAAGVLANWGILLSPAVGALLLSVGTIVVAINAPLLHRVTL